ncbi:MAG TPA: hypothetical protein VHB99_08890 [Pirellulales bacterium]|jgi:hypothetical protein|nr:hypothetical protein [Pirellulales bacterium]
MTNEIDTITPRDEDQYHAYTGNRIPWYVRLVWVGFWCFAVYYTVRYLFPDLQTELITPP